MSIAYIDCFAGAAGDMIVAALLDAGASFAVVESAVRSLPLGELCLRQETVHRKGLAARNFHVEVPPGEQPHRHLHHIVEIIEGGALPARAKTRATEIFTNLARAEAQVHGTSIEGVHFHEVGAVDSIVDIVAAVVAMEDLGLEELYCAPIPTGSGTVECDHGVMPVPAPATARLLVGLPSYGGPIPYEVTTPTAAAVLSTLCTAYGPAPEMTVRAIGIGAGDREGGPLPNVLRILVGECSDEGELDSMLEFSTNLDDCTGEIIGAMIGTLLAAGCVDAWATPATGKKSRPTWILSGLCEPAKLGAVQTLLFRETTTFGVRHRPCRRAKLQREHKTVETPMGPIRVKLGRWNGETTSVAPEYEDCAAAADAHGVPLSAVYQAARQAYTRENDT